MMVNGERVRAWQERLSRGLERGRGSLRRSWGLLAGMTLSAAALAGDFQPLPLGLLCAAPPTGQSVLLALGGALGYGIFWGREGLQGAAWMAGGLAASLIGNTGRSRHLLRSALAALTVAGTGVLFQLRWGDQTSVGMFLLRVAAAAGSAAVFSLWREQREGWSRRAVQTMGVLALAQISPLRYLDLGYAAAGILGAAGSFPSAVLGGLALDLSGIAPVPMTGAICLGCCLRQVPGGGNWWGCLSPGLGYVIFSVLSGEWDIRPLPPLLLGGALAGMYPEQVRRLEVRPRAGEAAVAQVRLERMALALGQMEQALAGVREPEADCAALLERAGAEACDTCPERKGCKARAAARQLPVSILTQPGLGEEDLPRGCRKSTRLLTALRRSQEQLRRIRGDRSRVQLCRTAVREQYQFLARYLRGISDDLAARRDAAPVRFSPEVGCSSRSAGEVSGDRCSWFAGTGSSYFVLLCDGMGTGEAAARESEAAETLLQQMLQAGIPAESALRSFNSLAILRQLGGCSTVDLLQLQLDSGRGTLYKWGAASSCLVAGGQLRRLGEQTPPPGISQQAREQIQRLSLARGELLILHSDGVGEGSLLQLPGKDRTVGEIAAWILEQSPEQTDDATVAVVRLQRV